MAQTFTTKGQAIKSTGLSYIGNVNHSAKIVKNRKKNVMTYIIYLSPSDSSGYNVCPKATVDCINACLHESGHNRIDTKNNKINKSRVKKTKMFYEDREFFMGWVYSEIVTHAAKAKEAGMAFSVRLNGTSDLSPELFKLNGKNLLQLFPDVQFYDYTKVYNRSKIVDKYSNYDLTFSYSGYNWSECEKALESGVRVAMVFEEVPAFYKGIEVINGDDSDLRYLDEPNVIVGLKFKKVRNKIDFTKQKFVISATDADCSF